MLCCEAVIFRSRGLVPVERPTVRRTARDPHNGWVEHNQRTPVIPLKEPSSGHRVSQRVSLTV